MNAFSTIGFWRVMLAFSLCRFGFGGSSSSNTKSTSQQNYTDARSVSSVDSHAVTDSGNTSTSNSNSLTNWLSNVGNTSTSASNVGNTSTTSTTTASNSGNTTIIGTDGGSVHIADMQAQLMQAVGEQNLDAVKAIAGLGSAVGGAATDLAALSQSNSMQLSTHMLDLTGELIDKMATGSSSAIAAQSAMVQAGAASAGVSTQAGIQKIVLIVGAVLSVALILKK